MISKTSRLSFRGAHQRVYARLQRAMARTRNPETQALPMALDSGFAASRRPGMTPLFSLSP